VVSALQAINRAQLLFSQTCGRQMYSPTLVGLGAPAPTTGRGFLSPDLTMDPVVKSGYLITMEAQAPEGIQRETCNGLVPAVTYRIFAEPVTPGVSGSRFFATNTDRIIYADTATYKEDMPQTGAPGHGSEVK
jgi:hypothetical protein